MNYLKFFNLLLAMENSKTISEVADKLYFSQSKASKLIKKYEKDLNVKLYEKKEESILSYEGKKILNDTYEKYKEVEDYFEVYFNKGKKKVGIDENIINEEKIIQMVHNNEESIEYIFANSIQIINDFNNNNIDEIICSEDFESEYKYCVKDFFLEKEVVRITNKNMLKMNKNLENIFLFEKGCPIRKKLEKKIKYSQEIYRIDKVVTLVSLNQGIGYLFKTSKFNTSNISIEEVDDLKVRYFHYKRK